MLSIKQSLHKIRDIASNWISDQASDGATAMGNVTATLLNTDFSEREIITIQGAHDPELEKKLREYTLELEGGKTEPTSNIYEGITDPDVLVRLEARIRDAEHKPGAWSETRQSMGGICTRIEPINVLALPVKEDSWASFSFKRDAWLAVEAVNALPELIGRLRGAEQGERAADAEVERLQGLLESAKEIGVAACNQIMATSTEPQAWLDVISERRRQASVEGHKPERDDCYTSGELAQAAGAYAIESTTNRYGESLNLAATDLFPWDLEHWKTADHRRNLVKAGALILAEIERLDRAEAAKPAELYTEAEEARMDVVGQNGNDGEHYSAVADDWIKWDADACGRIPKNVAAVRFKDGRETSTVSGVNWAPKSDSFRHTEVVAYRLKPADRDWVEWTGELCPVDDLDAMVWVRLEGVSEVRPGIARNWDWRTEPAMGRSRIVAYTLKDPAMAAKP